MSTKMMTKLTIIFSSRSRSAYSALALIMALMAIFAITGSLAFAKTLESAPAQISPIHPTFALLDENGENVLDSGKAVSTLHTCGACHDTAFIEQHSYHSDLGLGDFSAPGAVSGGRSWDSSPGLFGKWNPLIYRYLSPQGDERIDLGTADWIRELGSFHVGSGPAVTARDGRLLSELPVIPGDPQTNVVDPQTGQLTSWDWAQSGTVEMNCFLCHTPAPDNQARIDELKAGNFRWANTATLLQSGIVARVNGEYQYQAEAFSADGMLEAEFVQIQDPTNDNCGQCHGLVHDTLREPVVLAGCNAEQWRTQTTGQIISPQRLSDSGLNLADKATLTRTWDIHAERAVNCTDCHFSLNNPVYFQEAESSRPEHLVFDPRRLEIGEYLYQPCTSSPAGRALKARSARL
jgi:hypothetical protein